MKKRASYGRIKETTIGGFVMPRKYEKVRELLPIIKEMLEKGKSQEDVAKELGLANKQVIWNLLYRER